MGVLGKGGGVLFRGKSCDDVFAVAVSIIYNLLSRNKNFKKIIKIRPFAVIDGQLAYLGENFHDKLDLLEISKQIKYLFDNGVIRKVHLLEDGFSSMRISMYPSNNGAALDVIWLEYDSLFDDFFDLFLDLACEMGGEI